MNACLCLLPLSLSVLGCFSSFSLSPCARKIPSSLSLSLSLFLSSSAQFWKFIEYPWNPRPDFGLWIRPCLVLCFCALGVSIDPSTGTISSSTEFSFLPLFFCGVPTFLGPGERTVRCQPGGRSATGGQSGQELADDPLLLFCVADRSWRTVYSGAFQSVPGPF